MAKNELKARIDKKNKDRIWRDVVGRAREHFLDELRQARLAAQKDAEAFDQLLFVFERLGCYRLAEVTSLGDYRASLLALAEESALGGPLPEQVVPWHSDKSDLYALVNQARNDALHQGAGARHLTEHAIELALLFEDALMNGTVPMTKLPDIMVRSPVTAEPWQPVSFVRQVMLTNSFSALPIFFEHRWWVITDARVAAFLRQGQPNKAQRSERLCKTIEEVGTQLLTPAVIEQPPYADISDDFVAKLDGSIILVCGADRQGNDPSPPLLGIVTAFDIL
jgi:hypothetical protein